ncbi:MAG TPA: EAL domain-containing protein, partial [Gallionella sp.]|nr:EAL domain-containing protein [Gallionella sp.]
VDMDGRCTFINASGLSMLGYSDTAEVVGRNMHCLIHHTRPDGSHYPAQECRMYRSFSEQRELRVDDEFFWRKDGTPFPVEYWSHPIVKDGVAQGTVATFFDITERRRAENALLQSEMKFRTLFDSTGDAVMLLDERGFFDCNAAALTMFGCVTREEFCSKHPADLSPPEQPGGHDSMSLANQMIATAMQDGSHRFEWMHQRADNGATFPAEVLLSAMELDGKKVLQATVRDITERKQAEQQIHQLAFYDVLTGLPNRRLLMDRLHQALSVSARNGQYGAVLFLDLDHFKTLNDTRGHDIGDLLLLEVARRLKSCVRDGDTVARLGGDEFVLALETLSTITDEAVTQAERVAEKIHAALNQPYQLREHIHHTTPSIGIVLFRGHQASIDELLKYADTAMYQAKTAGRNAIRFYDPVMQAALEARIELEAALRQALDKQQFRLYYQIQVDSLCRPLGAEALLRWEQPERGLVSPAQFIPLAEETGLIVPMGLWVLQSACGQLAAWHRDARMRNLTLAVNVSAKQFRQPDFVDQVRRILLESGANPARLKLELTESTVLENVEDTISKMRELKMIGMHFSMDDFGTGYSSLQYLKLLPLDQIKIDQSFVRDIASDPNDAAIVQTIIAMSDALGLEVIAEGVETEAQREFLDRHGCGAFQGYLFSKPVPLDEFEALLPNNLVA